MIPLAMTIGVRAGVPRFLTALMVANGANAGNLSPVSAVAVIANTKMAEAGIVGHEWRVWFANFAAHAFVSVIAYFVFGGWGGREATATGATGEASAAPTRSDDAERAPLDAKQWTTLAVIAAWILSVVLFKVNVGLGAFGAAALLAALRSGDEAVAVKRMPWGVILMVCGISVLIGVLEKSGGMELFSSVLARLANAQSINGVIAGVTGLISTWSSTSGVVLPAFLPAVPTLVSKVGGGDPLAVALSINVGSALVDVSPLSTLGALCVATVTESGASQRLFRAMMIWGFSMALVGAVLCQLFAGPLARW